MQTDPFEGENDNSTNNSKKFKIIRTFDTCDKDSCAYEEYDGEGRLIRKGRYYCNKPDGPWLKKIFSSSHPLTKIKMYYSNGVLNGPYEAITPSISTIKTNYIDNLLNGLYEETQYDPSTGQLIYKIQKEIINNIDNGYFREETKDMIIEGTYHNSALNGLIHYYPKSAPIKRFAMLYKNGAYIQTIEAYDIQNRDMMLNDGKQIVWKGCKTSTDIKVVVKLEVQNGADRTRFVYNSDVLKVSKVKVLEIKDLSNNDYLSCQTLTDDGPITIYNIGDIIEVSPINQDVFFKTGPAIYVYKYRDYVI